MAKRIPLSEQIGVLVTGLGNAPPVSAGAIKSALMALVADAKNLEDGHLASEAVAEVAALKKKIKSLKEMHKAECEELRAKLDEAEAKFKQFQAAKEKQLDHFQVENGKLEAMLEKATTQLREEQQNREQEKFSRRPEIEERILLILRQPYSQDAHFQLWQVAQAAKLTSDVTSVHLERLKAAGLANHGIDLDTTTWIWSRSVAGNDYLVTHGLLK